MIAPLARWIVVGAVVALGVVGCAPIDGGYGDTGGGILYPGDLGYDEDRDVVLERARRTCVRRAEDEIGDVRRILDVDRTGRYRVDVRLRVRHDGQDDDVTCRYDDGLVRFDGVDRPRPEPQPPVDQEAQLERRAVEACTTAARGRGLRVESVTGARPAGRDYRVALRVQRGERRFDLGCSWSRSSGGARLDASDLAAGEALGGAQAADEGRARRACVAEARGAGLGSVRVLGSRPAGGDRYAVRLSGTRGERRIELGCSYDVSAARASLRD
jgi:hypothetical protein